MDVYVHSLTKSFRTKESNSMCSTSPKVDWTKPIEANMQGNPSGTWSKARLVCKNRKSSDGYTHWVAIDNLYGDGNEQAFYIKPDGTWSGKQAIRNVAPVPVRKKFQTLTYKGSNGSLGAAVVTNAENFFYGAVGDKWHSATVVALHEGEYTL